jgi:Domain of unknown function (DUF6798)
MKLKKIFPSLNLDTYWIYGFPLLFLIIVVFFFQFHIGDNELDAIPYAKSVYNNDWLKSDWYLNIKIHYRYLFSYLVGFFVNSFGFIETIFAGRIISYILIAISFNVLIKSVKAKSYNFLFYFAVILFFRFFPYGIGAGEWIVGDFETKVFAYGFAILSLSSFLHKQHQKGMLFAGLSLSFHLLVGIYNLFCLIPIIIFYQRESKDFIFKIFKSLPIFIIAGSIGIFGIIYQLFFIEKDITDLGWYIYVNIRVPHHTLPSFFPLKAWIIFPFFILCNLYFLLKSKKNEVKLLSLYALFSAIISLFGLAIFFLPVSNIHLKYYFFRFSDIMLPLITLLNITFFIIENMENSFSKKKYRLKYILAAIAFLIMIPKINYFLSEVDTSFQQIKVNTSNDNVMVNWVRNNTDTKKVFITHPVDKFFYINYERPMFVGWKHIPSGAKDIVEWYNRLKLLNRSQDFKSIKEIKQNYLNLTEKEIIAISQEYPNVSYVLMPKSIKLNFPTLFKSSRYILYEIRNITN